MDSDSLWLLSLILLSLTVLLRQRVGRKRVNGKLPPSPPAWPIIGHLHLLSKLPHQVMAQLSNTYGPVFYLRLGSKPALVISSPLTARHFLQLHDASFSNRPPSELHRRVLHGKSVVFMNYGQEWRDVRRICSTVVFHPKMWDSSEALRTEEVSAMLKAVAAAQKRQPVVDLSRICADFVISTMNRLLFTDTQHTRNIAGVSQMTSDLSAIPVFGDFIPWLRCMDWRAKREMDRVAAHIDSMFGKLVNERLNETDRSSPPDFLDALLSAQKDDRFPSYTEDQSVIQTCMDILSASTETTATAMEWTMAELLANPAQLKRLQEEINQVAPDSERMVNSEDLRSMSYLKAVIKESLRLHPPFCLILRHASGEGEIEVGGYSVPPNCSLFVNVWAMGRDPAIWDDPLCFDPARFLSGQSTETQESVVELSGQHFQLLPFGTGRRRCPGIAIAMAMLEVGLSNLVHAFHWNLPAGVRPEQLDMAERHSLFVSRLNPLLACAISRH